jgi:hypothetical protein
MRPSLVLYLVFVATLVGGFVIWALLTHDPNERITAWVTAGMNALLGAFVTFLNTGKRIR